MGTINILFSDASYLTRIIQKSCCFIFQVRGIDE